MVDVFGMENVVRRKEASLLNKDCGLAFNGFVIVDGASPAAIMEYGWNGTLHAQRCVCDEEISKVCKIAILLSQNV